MSNLSSLVVAFCICCSGSALKVLDTPHLTPQQQVQQGLHEVAAQARRDGQHFLDKAYWMPSEEKQFRKQGNDAAWDAGCKGMACFQNLITDFLERDLWGSEYKSCPMDETLEYEYPQCRPMRKMMYAIIDKANAVETSEQAQAVLTEVRGWQNFVERMMDEHDGTAGMFLEGAVLAPGLGLPQEDPNEIPVLWLREEIELTNFSIELGDIDSSGGWTFGELQDYYRFNLEMCQVLNKILPMESTFSFAEDFNCLGTGAMPQTCGVLYAEFMAGNLTTRKGMY